jgi:hypothetical protein
MRALIKILWVGMLALSLGAIAAYAGGWLYAESLNQEGQPEEMVRQVTLEWTSLATWLFFGAVGAGALGLLLDALHRRTAGTRRDHLPGVRKRVD